MYIYKILNHFPMYNVWCYQPVLLYSVSLALSNWNSDDAKWRGSAKCHIELAKEKKKKKTLDGRCLQTRLSIHPLNLTDFRSKRDSDRKILYTLKIFQWLQDT
jgi:hypothetical protein